MNLRKFLRQYHLTSSLLIAFCAFGTAIEPALAEGSKDLFPSNPPAGANRGHIIWQSGLSGGFRRRTLLRVFAKQGEYILVGSSAVGIGSGNIEIYNPGTVSGNAGNESIPTTANFVCSSQRTGQASGTGNGFIASRTQELTGPKSIINTINNTSNPNRYTPCYYQAPTTGIYFIAIYGPSGKASSASPNNGVQHNIGQINTGTNQNTGISAWDVTVRSNDTSSTTDLNGRLHTYFINMNMGANGYQLHSDLYPITIDGYRYQIDLNGLDPFGFRIFGNLLGNLDSDGKSPLYHDVIGDDGSIADPEGNTSSAPPQFPIFFNELDEDVLSDLQIYDPVTGSEVGTGFAASPIIPVVTSPSYSGNLSGNKSTVNEGGTFSFDSNMSGVYEITISRDGVDFDPNTLENRVLRGLMPSGGTQTVEWNGLDNTGDPFPVGEFNYQVKIHAGEYHFPISDAENNFYGGPTYTLLNGTNPLGNTTAFYDHSGYYTIDGTLVPDAQSRGEAGPFNDDPNDPTDGPLCGDFPPDPPATNLATGADSSDPNFNKFGRNTNSGSNTNTKCTGSFGDTKTLDLWTYRPSTPVQNNLVIVEFDHGDAPVSYDDTADDNDIIDENDNPAKHTPSSNLYLGSIAPDAEAAPQSSTNANGDDNATAPNIDDEDAFTNLPNVNATATATGNYSLNVPVTNTSGGNATLHGWIDFNKNGKFESGEYQSADVNNNTSPVNLTWAVPAGTTVGNTHARLRLTSDASVNGNTPNGAANNGEVEDYPVEIVPAPLYDYGDAPDASAGTGTGNYKTTAADEGAAQVVIDTADRVLSIGNSIDIDDGSLQSSNADADDTSGSTPDDEDGVSSFPTLTTTEGQTYTVTVTARNNVPTVPAYLVGFIDFNKDGDFEDDGERSDTVIVASDALGNNGELRTFDVIFTTPAGMTPGDTYARFRLGQVETTAQQAARASTGTDNGEVEDYKIAIASQLPTTTCDGREIVELSFTNPQLEPDSGDELQVGAIYRFSDVTSGIDALVEVEGFNNGASLEAIDNPDAGTANAFQPTLNPAGTTDPDDDVDSSVDFNITWVQSGTNTPIPIFAFNASGIDIDGDGGQLREYIQLDNFSNYFLESDTVLTADYDSSTTTGRFESSTTDTQDGISISAANNIVTAEYDDVSSFKYRIGAIDSVSSTTNRLNSLNFECISLSDPQQNPATFPNLLLVKRITAINLGQSDEIQFNSFVNDDSDNDGDLDNDPDNDPNWPDGDDTYLRGATTVADIEPGDEVEYTIYFLSSGNEPATNIKICDVVPDNMTFVTNSYGSEAGMGLALDETNLPTEPNRNLSNAADTDEGTFYAPGTAPPTVTFGDPPTERNLCSKVTTNNTTVEVNATNNNNGAIVVEIDSLPEATDPGTPANSYGFIRFRAEVQ